MTDRKVIRIALFVLLIISLLTIGASAGWSQGFVAGQLITDGVAGVTTPHLGYGYGWGYGPLFFLGGCLKFFFLLFLFMCIGKMFRFWGWRRHGWHKGYDGWKHHAHHRPGFHPQSHDKHHSQRANDYTTKDKEDPFDDTIRYA